MKIGYARVSSTSQSLELQIEALQQAGCEKIYQEKESGGSTTRRFALEKALDQLRAGDELVVTRLDRLARSVPDLYGILQKASEAGAGFACLHQSGVDTSSPTGKLMLGILGVIAEFERDLIKERQVEGIRKAREKGVYRGGRRKLDPAKVLAAYKEHGDKAHKHLGCARSTVYRIVQEEAARLQAESELEPAAVH
jgi:DNA invertase Pin-like site-specific DNA recombinase